MACSPSPVHLDFLGGYLSSKEMTEINNKTILMSNKRIQWFSLAHHYEVAEGPTNYTLNDPEHNRIFPNNATEAFLKFW